MKTLESIDWFYTKRWWIIHNDEEDCWNGQRNNIWYMLVSLGSSRKCSSRCKKTASNQFSFVTIKIQIKIEGWVTWNIW